jgi:hypothetical protein
MKKIKYHLCRLYWWFFVVVLSLRWVWKFNLGDEVWYLGERWYLTQGVQAPKWNLKKTNMYVTEIYESHFRKVRSLKNYYGSFRRGYQFYMLSWFDIWCRKGIEPWMKSLPIWGRRKHEKESLSTLW